MIDFTEKIDEEIQQYILNHFNESLCGRFKNSQVQRIAINLPENIFRIQMPLWMRFLVACLLIFGISLFPFETTIAGKTPNHTGYYQGEPIAVNSAKKPGFLKKKKRKKHRRTRMQFPDITGMEVMGSFPGLSDPPISKTLSDSSSEFKYPFNLQPGTVDARPPKKDEAPKMPNTPTEFILPKLLAMRKENNSDNMD